MGWELITPDSLAELDSSQNTKLGGVATGATVGATVGTNFYKTGTTTNYNTNEFQNADLSISAGSSGVFTLNRGVSTTTTTINKSNLGLSYTDGADITGSNTSYDTARVSGTTAATINTGAGRANAAINSSNLVVTGLYSSTYGSSDIHSMVTAQARANAGLASSGDVSRAVPQGYGGTGLTSNSTLLNSNTTKSNVGLSNVPNYSAETMRAGTTSSHVGLSNVPNYSAETMRSGTTKAHVGLGSVDNNSTSTIRGGISISSNGTLNGGGGGQVTAGGLGANTDSTATIRNGVITFVTSTSPSIVWSNLSGNMTPAASAYYVTVTFKNGSGTTVQTTQVKLSRSSTTALNAATVHSGSSSGFTGGSATNAGTTQTSTVTYSGITCTLTALVIDGSAWTFKPG